MRAIALVVAFAVIGCSGPSPDDRHAFATPSRMDFPPVADVLESHCGSLDCHGSTTRNLRIYGINGQRINGTTGTGPTTDAEYDATFLSVALLEPEIIGQVVVEKGRQPERLTLVRKARGAEAHKGGAQMPKDSDGDRCLVIWLAGGLDVDACAAAAELTRPETP